MGVVWAILAVLGFLLVAVLVVILTPIRVTLALSTAPVFRVSADIRALGGLAPAIRLRPGAAPSPETVSAPRAANARTPKKPRRARRRPPLGRILRAVPDLLHGLLSVLRIERLSLEGRFGLDDPADTGTAWGMVAPVLYAVQGAAPGRVSVLLAPDFDRAHVDAAAEAQLTVRPARLIAPALVFAWRVWGPERRVAR